ncbi:hypothetical protein [Acetobacter cibinongensis]|uniref:Uncharacterized protein n=1 Tax=Acetobacter cibinongensis TaxID=146475 RepID=A0A1Z5YR22_9PROT|nr:hypothetical protein [Acetobacter cibinongensis]OUI97767.1 hypothetical protein HK14_01875 [Acetobacter cibinongensis]
MAGALFTMINGVQDRNNASDAYDTPYKNAAMDALGRKETSFLQNRNNLIDFYGEKAVINDKIYETIHDRTASGGDISFVRNKMYSGYTIQQVIHEEAYSPEATAALTTVTKMATGQTPSDATTLQPYQDAMANGGSLNDAIYQIAHSDKAKTIINNFSNNNFGFSSSDLTKTGQSLLTGIVQAYQSVKNYTLDQLQAAASNYNPSLGNGLLLDKIMPTTWQGWVGTVTLRTVSSSGKNWTIDFKNPLNNGVKKIKFSK